MARAGYDEMVTLLCRRRFVRTVYLVVFSVGVSAVAVIARFHAWRERDLARRGEQQAAISALHAEIDD